MLRQLLLICAIGGLPLVSIAAETAATGNISASEDAANESGKAFECTQKQVPASSTQRATNEGPVWVVQNPATSTPASQQGPVWVVQQEPPVKPMS